MSTNIATTSRFRETLDGRRLFSMTGIRNPANWQHVFLVAKDDYRDYPSHEMINAYADGAYCTECNKDISYSSGQTGGITRHMSSHKKKKKKKSSKRRKGGHGSHSVDLPTFSSASEVSDSDDASPKITKSQQQHLTALISLWLAGSHRPYSLVEDPGFRRLMKFVATDLGQVRLKVPSRTTVSKAVGKQASRLRALLKKEIAIACEYYSLTTDAWTDRAMRSYVALTLHYIDQDFAMKDYVLEVEAFDGKHTAATIRDKLDEVLDRWSLDKAFCTKLIRDGASNVTKGVELLGVEHMSCIAHCLHLVVAGALIRKKGKLANQAILDILEAEREEERLAREAQEAQEAANVAAGVHAAGSSNVASLAAALPNNSRPSSSGAQEQEEESDDDDDGPSLIDGNMADTWNKTRDLACDEVDEHVQEVLDSNDQTSLEYTRMIVQSFRSLAVYFRKSAKAKSRLKQLRKQKQPTVKQYFSLDCPTRWNSWLDMLARFSILKPTVLAFFAYLDTAEGRIEFGRLNLPKPTSEQWFVVRCLLQILYPFQAVTEYLSGGQYPTLAIAFPALREIKSTLRRLDVFDEEARIVNGYIFAERTLARMHHLRQTLLKLFLKRFSAMPRELLWTSYLDPRLTDLQYLTSGEIQRAQQLLLSAAAGVASPVPTPSRRVDEPPPTLSTPAKARLNTRTGIFGTRAAQSDAATSAAATRNGEDLHEFCLAEFKKYLTAASTVLPDENPLAWWKANTREFPTLAKLARRWLGCVATSVPSERAFSAAGRVVTAHRCSLKPELVRDTVFIAANTQKKKKKKRVGGQNKP